MFVVLHDEAVLLIFPFISNIPDNDNNAYHVETKICGIDMWDRPHNVVCCCGYIHTRHNIQYGTVEQYIGLYTL